MLERLISQVGGTNIDRTLHIAAAYASHKDPLPGLAITVLAEYEASRKPLAHMGELVLVLRKRIGKRVTLQPNDVVNGLLWWLSPECETCHGLKHEVLADSPTLADAVCPACIGRGLKPHTQGSKGYAATLELLDGAYAWAARVSERMPTASRVREMAEV